MMTANKRTIQTRLLHLVRALVACLVAAGFSGCTGRQNPGHYSPGKGDSWSVIHFSDVIQERSDALVRRTNHFTVGIGGGTNVHGCAWSWPYTNALNGYFRIERKDRLDDPQWQLATNTLWCHYLETNKPSGYFRGWYMNNLFGMIPIRVGN